MTPASRFASVGNGEALDFSRVPVVPIEEFRTSVLKMAEAKHRFCALMCSGSIGGPPAGLLAVLADDVGGRLYIAASEPVTSYKALTPELPQAHLFEREIFEGSGVIPEGIRGLSLCASSRRTKFLSSRKPEKRYTKSPSGPSTPG